MCVRATLYTVRIDFSYLFPGEHGTRRFLLASQPTTGSINKCGRNVKRSWKGIFFQYWKSVGKKIGETIIERYHNRSFRQITSFL